jgi:hypothetical protein
MVSAESLPAPGAGQLQVSFQMLDSDSACGKVNILYRDSQGFRDTASQVK